MKALRHPHFSKDLASLTWGPMLRVYLADGPIGVGIARRTASIFNETPLKRTLQFGLSQPEGRNQAAEN